MTARPYLLIALVAGAAACSVPNWPEFPPYCDPAVESCSPGQDGAGGTSGGHEEASGGVQTVTGDSQETTSPPDPPSETSAAEPGGPAIDNVLLTPDPIELAGSIAIEVTATDADGVRMERAGLPPVDLKSAPDGRFTGEIEVLTGLSNGTHEATFVPLRRGVGGTAEIVPYFVALPPAGTEVLWDAVPDNGLGQIEALGVLSDGATVGLGTLFDGNDARCYLHRRNPDGTYGNGDVQIIFAGYECTAVDLVVADKTIYLLTHVVGGDGLRWRMAVTTWGATPTVLRTGLKDEFAHALARSPNSKLVACGTGPSPMPLHDAIDGRIWTFNGPDVELDYKQEPTDPTHKFDETVNDCAFAGERLVLVGKVFGRHEEWDPAEPARKRPFVLEIDDQDESPWFVPGLGPGNTSQGAASTLAIDDQGRYIVGLHTCGDVCDPEAELRIYEPGGEITWQVTLPAQISEPLDLAWSPAGYVVIAGAEGTDWSTRFLLQGYVPGTFAPAWSFMKAPQDEVHVARAVAVAPDLVVGGGLGSGGFPAVALVRP